MHEHTASENCDTDSNVWKNLFIRKLTFCFLFVEDASPLISLALSAVWWRRSYSEVCWNAINRWKAQSGGLWLNSTRHSSMTRINKYSCGCNADSLCSICSPSGPVYHIDVWKANMRELEFSMLNFIIIFYICFYLLVFYNCIYFAELITSIFFFFFIIYLLILFIIIYLFF